MCGPSCSSDGRFGGGAFATGVSAGTFTSSEPACESVIARGGAHAGQRPSARHVSHAGFPQPAQIPAAALYQWFAHFSATAAIIAERVP
jgi:hypothetical protein